MVVTRCDVVAEILRMLTDESSPLTIQPGRQKEAASYLEDCLLLFSDEHPRKKLYKDFYNLCVHFTPNTKRKGLKGPFAEQPFPFDHEGIVVALKILSTEKSEYESQFRLYFLQQMRAMFEDVRKMRAKGYTRFQKFVKTLKQPLTLLLDDLRSLVEYVRILPDKGRDRCMDIHWLACLLEYLKSWSTGSLQKPLASIMRTFGPKSQALTFDLLHLLAHQTHQDDYQNLTLLRLADSCVDMLFTKSKNGTSSPDRVIADHSSIASALKQNDDCQLQDMSAFAGYVLAELKHFIPTIKSTSDRQWLCSVLMALVSKDNQDLRCSLVEMAKVGRQCQEDGNQWQEKLFQIASVANPKKVTAEYLYDLWIKMATGSRSKEPVPDPDRFKKNMPEGIVVLTEACKRFFDEEALEKTIRRLEYTLDDDQKTADHYGWYMRRVLWLSCMCPNLGRDLVKDISRYQVVQKQVVQKHIVQKHTDYYVQHVKACLALLLIPKQNSALRSTRCVEAAKIIRSLHEADTMGSLTTDKKEQQVAENFRIIRKVVLPKIEELIQ